MCLMFLMSLPEVALAHSSISPAVFSLNSGENVTSYLSLPKAAQVQSGSLQLTGRQITELVYSENQNNVGANLYVGGNYPVNYFSLPTNHSINKIGFRLCFDATFSPAWVWDSILTYGVQDINTSWIANNSVVVNIVSEITQCYEGDSQTFLTADLPDVPVVTLMANQTYRVALMGPSCGYCDAGFDWGTGVEPSVVIDFTLYWATSPSNITIAGEPGAVLWSFPTPLNKSNSPQTVLLNTTAIDNFLTTCASDAFGNCYFPLRFSSETAGQIQIASSDVRYPHLHIPSALARFYNTTTYFNNNTSTWQTNESLTDSSLGSPGQKVNISASITNSTDAPSYADFVRARILRPDGQTDVLQLAPLAPGSYAANYTGTSLNGTYNVTIEANSSGQVNATLGTSFDVGNAAQWSCSGWSAYNGTAQSRTCSCVYSDPSKCTGDNATVRTYSLSSPPPAPVTVGGSGPTAGAPPPTVHSTHLTLPTTTPVSVTVVDATVTTKTTTQRTQTHST